MQTHDEPDAFQHVGDLACVIAWRLLGAMRADLSARQFLRLRNELIAVCPRPDLARRAA